MRRQRGPHTIGGWKRAQFADRMLDELERVLARVRAIPEAYDPDLGRRLWETSEELTGVRYGPAAGAA